MSMKPLLIVVPLHPKRECRAKAWLEKENDIATIKYLPPRPIGEPIYGKGGQLYSSAALHKAVFEAVYDEWLKNKHRFFGVCLDDVVVENERVLAECIKILENDPVSFAVGAVAPEMPKMNGQTVLMRFWITFRHALRYCSYEELFRLYDMPDWEPAWQTFSGSQCCEFPNLKLSHLLPISGRAEEHGLGWKFVEGS